MEAKPRIELEFQLYQSRALPLSYKAELERATRIELADFCLEGKLSTFREAHANWGGYEESNLDLRVRSPSRCTLHHTRKLEHLTRFERAP